MQRDIFVIGLNDAFQRFCCDIISHKDLTSLTFAQVISKVRDCDTSIQMDSAITQWHLEDSTHDVTSAGSKPKLLPCLPWCMTGPPTESARSSCIWCGRTAHPMASAMVVANVGTGNRFVGCPLQMWY